MVARGAFSFLGCTDGAAFQLSSAELVTLAVGFPRPLPLPADGTGAGTSQSSSAIVKIRVAELLVASERHYQQFNQEQKSFSADTVIIVT